MILIKIWPINELRTFISLSVNFLRKAVIFHKQQEHGTFYISYKIKFIAILNNIPDPGGGGGRGVRPGVGGIGGGGGGIGVGVG